MPLIVELAPFERVFIGPTVLRNGPQRWRFEVEVKAKVVRGREYLARADATTPLQRFYALLLEAFMSRDPAAFAGEVATSAGELCTGGDVRPDLLDTVVASFGTGAHYAALRAARRLVQDEYEAGDRSGPDPFVDPETAAGPS